TGILFKFALADDDLIQRNREYLMLTIHKILAMCPQHRTGTPLAYQVEKAVVFHGQLYAPFAPNSIPQRLLVRGGHVRQYTGGSAACPLAHLIECLQGLGCLAEFVGRLGIDQQYFAIAEDTDVFSGEPP